MTEGPVCVPGPAMVHDLQSGTGFHPPTTHSGGDFRIPVFATVLQGEITADGFVTFASYQLGRVRHRSDIVRYSFLELSSALLIDHAAGDSQAGLRLKV